MKSRTDDDNPQYSTLNVLVVDDDPDMGQLLKLKLQEESERFNLTTLLSGSKCLELVKENPVDCIISDYQMPGMDGMELLVKLRESGNDTPFIFVTGQGSEEVAREAFKNGAFDYFTKEIGFAYFSKISNSIQRAIEQKKASEDKALLEAALQKAAYGVSEFTGKDFFDVLVRYLAGSIGADYAFIGELNAPEMSVIRTRSVFAKGESVPNFDYELDGTPCADVIDTDICCFSTGVQNLFPQDTLLQEMGADSYAGAPLFDSSGNPLGILVVLDSRPLDNQEYTTTLLRLFAGRASAELERLRMEEDLKKSEEKYRKLMDNASDAIFLGDPETGIILDANSRAETLIGRDAADIIGMHQSELHPPQDREHYVQIFKNHLEGGGSHPIEAEIINASGKRVPVEITSSLVEIEGRTVLQGIFRNITERKMAEESFATREKFLSDIFSSMRDGISVLDTEFNILRVNRTIEKWYAHSMPLVGKKCYSAYKGMDRPCEICPTRTALIGNMPASNVVPKLGSPKEADEWMEVYSFPLIDSDTGETTGVVEYMRDVTESKKTESTALALGRILEESLNEIYIFDAETLKFSQVNKGARENLGYTLEELRGLTPLDLKPEFTPGAFEQTLTPLRTGEKEKVELSTLQKRKDGSLYPVETHLQMSNYAGRPVIAETARDVTRIKRAQSRLKRSNRLLQSISEAQSVYIMDKDGTEVYNMMLRELLDLTNSEYGFIGEVIEEPDGKSCLVVKAFADIVSNKTTMGFYEKNAPEGMKFTKLDNLFGEVVLTGKPVISNDPARDPKSAGLPNGHPPLDSFLGLPIIRGGRMVGMAGIANKPSGYKENDIEYLEPFIKTCGNIIESEWSARLRAEMEESIRKSEAGLRSIIEALPDMVMSLGRDGSVLHVKYYNEREFADLENGEPDYGLKIQEVLPAEVSDTARNSLDQVFEDGRMRSFEYQVILPQKGTMHYEARLVKSSGEEVIAIVRDITEHRELEHQKADMLAMIRHDVKTPLSVILGYVDIMQKDKAGTIDPETSDMVRSIGKNSRYISMLLDDMVDVFKLEAGGLFLKKAGVLPLDIVLETKINASDTAKKAGVKLVKSVEDGLPELELDKSYINRALMNLTINALTFTPQGGTVTIGCAAVTEEGRDYVAFTVTDTGPGIPEEEHDKVFQKYYRSPMANAKEGTGLGLAIVKAVTEAHGGRVTLDSSPGKGSTFKMLLPV